MPVTIAKIAFLLIALGIGFTFVASAEEIKPAVTSSSPHFIQNKGQITDADGNLRPDVLFVSRHSDKTIYFRQTGISYVFHRFIPEAGEEEAANDNTPAFEDQFPKGEYQTYRLDVDFEGANANVVVAGESSAHTRFNYYYSHCPDGKLNVPSFKKIIYKEIYPGINLVFYYAEKPGEGIGLKYDFILRPGTDPQQIGMRYIGADKISLVEENLVLQTPLGNITELMPVALQEDREIKCSFVLNGSKVRFEVAEYDPGKELIIDPFVRDWATLMGIGISGAITSQVGLITVDSVDNVYMAGGTPSDNLPTTTGVFQSSKQSNTGDREGFLAKFSSTGQLIWATYYGGSSGPSLFTGVAIHGNEKLVIGGYTEASNFPVTSSGYQTTYAGGGDAVLVVFDTTGARDWATFYGGSDNEPVIRPSTDRQGNIYCTGTTYSSNFPVSSGAHQTSFPTSTLGSRKTTAFLIKFTSTGSRLWSTFYGGSSGSVNSQRIAIDTAGNIMIAGQVSSTSLPITSNAYSSTANNLFIAQFSPAGSLNYSSYFGGNGTEGGYVHTDFDENNNYYVSIATRSTNLPVTGKSFLTNHPTQGSKNTIYLAKFSPNHNLIWSTYYGGSDDVTPRSLIVQDNKIFICADIIGNTSTFSSNFPVTPYAFQTQYKHRSLGIAQFDYEGNRLFSTVYGGRYQDGFGILAYNKYTEALYISGNTESFDFPLTPGVFRDSLEYGKKDIFLLKFIPCTFQTTITADTGWHCPADSVLLAADTAYDAFLWSTGDTTQSIWVHEGGEHWLMVYDTSGCAGYDTVFIKKVPDSVNTPVTKFYTSVKKTSQTTGEVLLQWDSVPPDTHYRFLRIYHKHPDSSNYVLVADSILLSDTAFVHTGINTAEKVHKYYIAKHSLCGDLDSIRSHVTLDIDFDIGQLTHYLNWNRYAGDDSLLYYLLQIKRSDGSWDTTDTLSNTDSSYIKYPAPCNLDVTYRLAAVSAEGFVSYSDTATNQALDTIPADAPVITTATMISDSIVRLDFTGADSMDIFVFDIRRIDSAGNSVSAFQIPFTAPGVQYTSYDTLGNIGEKVCYAVIALDSCLNATSSDTFCVILLQGEEGQMANHLQWHPYKGFSPFTYVLQRDEGSGWADITTPTDTFYTDSAVACNLAYDYRVLAISVTGDTSVSNEITLTPFDTLSPAAPVLKSASVQLDQSVRLEWYPSASPDAKFYEIWCDEGSGFNLLTTVEYDSVYEDLSANGHQQTYSYYVIAIDSCNSANRSTPSDTDKTIRVYAQTGACVPLVQLQWDAYTDLPQQTDEYRIWRSEAGAGFQQEYTVTAGSQNFTDSNVTENSTYCYRIEAVDNNSGISAFSDTICIMPWVFPEPDTARIVRTTVEKTDDVAGNILVEWAAADAADIFARGYFLYHSTFSAAGPFTLLQDITNLSTQSYVHQNVDTRTTHHFYKVVVYNLCANEGPDKETHSPINLEVNNQNLQAELYWTHYKGFPIEQYELKRSEDGQPYQTHAVFAPQDSFYIDSTIICGHEYAWQVFGYNYSYNLITVSDSVWATAYDSIFPEVAEIRFVTVAETGTADGEVLVEWNASPSADVDYYTLYRREAGAGTWTEAATNITALSYTDQNINTSNTSYEYRLKVTDECENEVFSQIHRTINLTATPGEEKITLNWNHYGGWPVKEYELYRDGNLYKTLSSTETTFTDTLVFCTETYNYKIIAYADSSIALTSESNTGSARSLDTKAPGAVYFRTASVSNPNDEIYLEWEETTEFDAQNYILYRKLPGDRKWREITKPALGTNTYYDKVDIGDEPICYRVTVEDFCNNESIESNYGCIIIPTGTAEKLHNVIHWTPYEQWTQGVQKYRVYRSNDGNAWQQVGEVNGSTLTYTDNDLGEEDITDFCYQIEAVEQGGPGSESQSKVVCLQQEPIVWVPNAFTPTTSVAVNDGFEPKGLYMKSYTMRIYSRWGGLVYETTNSQPWNGRSSRGEHLQEGVYAYEIEVQSHTGRAQSFKGTVVLLR